MLKRMLNARQVIFLSKEEIEERLNLCKACDNFTEKQFCKICGCYMPIKVTVRRMECPIGKWKKNVSKN